MILLDTCLISETLKPNPSGTVLSWLEDLPEDRVYLPSPVLGELKKGVELLPPGEERDLLEVWLEQLSDRFSGRILALDEKAALIWGELSARMQKAGRTLPVTNGWIAALAISSGAVLATRNTQDFEGTGVTLVNPWSD